MSLNQAINRAARHQHIENQAIIQALTAPLKHSWHQLRLAIADKIGGQCEDCKRSHNA